MTINVVATLQPLNLPPRVRLDVTSVGGGNLQATVTRLGADGRTVPVRTPDGNPLPLAVSGSDRVGLVYDYEPAYGTTVQYGTSEAGLSGSPLLVDVAQPWLIHVGVPTLSQPAAFGEGSFGEELLAVSQGVFRPLGRSTAVVVTDGARKDPQSSFTLIIENLAQLAGLKALLKNASTLLLNVPVGLNTGVDTDYIAVGDVPIRRLTPNVIDGYRLVPVPYTVVARPAGGSQSQRTYGDVLNAFSTYGDVLSAYSSYADMLAPTT